MNRLRSSGRLVLLIALVSVGATLMVYQTVRAAVAGVGFAAPQTYVAGTVPFASAPGDFNGDHIPDLAVANNSTNNVSVFIGKGDGTFLPAVNYAVGLGPTHVVAQDVNGDLVLDLIVADESNGSISILLGNADGTFRAGATYKSGSPAPHHIAVGDFNGDGKIDFAVANNLGNNVSIFIGNGDGTFLKPVNYAAHTHPKSVATGDFNSDGKLDLVVVNYDTSDASILLGNGDGSFQPPFHYAVGLNPRDVAVADFDRDGKLDLAVANGLATTVSILLGNVNGTFQGAVNYTTATSPRSIAVADYNGDGFVDLATSNYSSGNVTVLLGNGDGTFTSQNFAVAANPTSISTADFNVDGKPDLAVTIGGPASAPSDLVAILINLPFSVTPLSLNFGTQLIGSRSSGQAVTLSNSASTPLSISGISFSGTGATSFSQTNTCAGVVPANGSCQIQVFFTPGIKNAIKANLTVSIASPALSQVISLQGVGTAVSLSPATVDFGNQAVGSSSSPQTVTLTNTSSNMNLSLTGIAVTGANAADFRQTNTCPGTVTHGQSCVISVTFTPSAGGPRSAGLQITDTGGGSPQFVTLTGTGR